MTVASKPSPIRANFGPNLPRLVESGPPLTTMGPISTRGPTPAQFGHSRAKLVQIQARFGHDRVHFGPGRRMLVESGQILSKSNRVWPPSGPTRPTSPKSGRVWAQFVQIRAEFGNYRVRFCGHHAALVEAVPSLSKSGPKAAQIRSNSRRFGRVWPTLANIGPYLPSTRSDSAESTKFETTLPAK